MLTSEKQEFMPSTALKPKRSKAKRSSSRHTSSRPKAKTKHSKKDLSETYNEFKQFEGQQYTGMKVGRSHKWYYDKGDWRETKITPDLWQISYAVKKRRAGKAPEGSGVPEGTAYHWYILAHQNVKKLNANDYSTSLSGLKYKLGHKRQRKMERHKQNTTKAFNYLSKRYNCRVREGACGF